MVHGILTVITTPEIVGPSDGNIVRFMFRGSSNTVEESTYDVFLKVPQASFKEIQKVLQQGTKLNILYGAWESKEGKHTVRLSWSGIELLESN
jgi:hypothetical protein